MTYNVTSRQQYGHGQQQPGKREGRGREEEKKGLFSGKAAMSRRRRKMSPSL